MPTQISGGEDGLTPTLVNSHRKEKVSTNSISFKIISLVMSTGLFEPKARHSSSVPLLSTGKLLYLWGGLTHNFSKSKSELTAVLEVYNPFMECWKSSQTRGVPPPGLYGGASASNNGHIYVYGGLDGKCRFGSLHRLDVQSLRWTQLSQECSYNGPMKKEGCGMVVCGRMVVVFGGYGMPNGVIQGGSEWIRKDQCPNGWTNELHCFDLDKGVWCSPAVSGSRPPPCTSFTMNLINDTSVVLFGGRQSEQRYNHSYILDMTQRHWTRLNHNGPRPVGRSSHAAVCLNYGEDCPQLVVTGGVDNALNVRSDIWVLDVHSSIWIEVSSNVLQSRCGHCAASFKLGPGLADVIIFGGCPKWPENPKSNLDFKSLADTSIFRFEKRNSSPNGEWVLVDVANKAQRGSSDRLHEKMEKLSHLVCDAQQRQKETEASLAEALAQCNVEIQSLTNSKNEVERRMMSLEARCQDLSRRLENMELEHELERREWAAQVAQRDGYKEEERGWLVESKEINIMDEVLGGGGWGEVMVAEFRGIRVAAKRLYRELQYPYYHDIFVREMNIAAKVRHPNLVQFIGASMDEEMVILMELVPTSLRQHITNNAPAIPSETFRISVSLDVAKALNYLHLMQPQPIIHRDISSANVLLEPLPNQKWRAKVTDYGSVNLQSQLSTKNPGSPVYSAPESNDPSLQSPKMDIYSCGVLFVEMCTSRFPDPSIRERMIGGITEENWVGLIYQCIRHEPHRRPSSAMLVSTLTSWYMPSTN